MDLVSTLSPGHLVVLWKLILILKANNDTPVKDVISELRTSGILGGSIPAHEGIKIGVRYEIFVIVDGKLSIHDFCKKDILPLCEEEEINQDAVHVILKKIIFTENFPWISYFDLNIENFEVYIPANWRQLFSENELLDLSNEKTIDWWRSVFQRYQKYKEGQKIQVGNVGEKLTYSFEINRLERDGIEKPDLIVKWVSLISDRFGFDIFSLRGVMLLQSFQRENNIQIEVKAQEGANIETFRFFVSKPEWNKALEDLESYFFYCWSGVKVDSEIGVGPFIIPAKKLEGLMPEDRDKQCEWSECRVILDLNKFSIYSPEMRNS